MMMRERRGFGRRKFYSSDHLKASIAFGGNVAEGFVTDLSMAGASVALRGKFSRAALSAGAEVDFTMEVGTRAHPIELRASVVHSELVRASGENVLKIGLLFVSLQNPSPRGSERRKGARFSCSDFLVPSLWCEHPWLYQEKIFFRVLDFGSDGMTLETSAYNKTLLRGLELQGWLSMPGQNPLPCEFQVVRVSNASANENRLRVSVRFIQKSAELVEGIAAYCLLVDPAISMNDLRKSGFVPASMSKIAICDYVHSESDLRQLQKLRGGFDEYDKFSRQIVCKLGSKVIACARVLFNEGKRQRSGMGARALLPAELWNEGFLEVSQMVVLPEFDDTDVVRELLRFVVRVGILSKFRYVLMECHDNYLAEFQEMGAQLLNLRLSSSDSKAQILNVVRWDCKALQAGWGGTAAQWATTFGPMLRNMALQGAAPVASRARIRMAIDKYAKAKSLNTSDKKNE